MTFREHATIAAASETTKAQATAKATTTTATTMSAACNINLCNMGEISRMQRGAATRRARQAQTESLINADRRQCDGRMEGTGGYAR